MINLTVVIDNDEAIKKLRELQSVARSSTSSIVNDSERIDDSFSKIESTLKQLVAGVSIGALAKEIIQVRGEVQQLEVAFETMLGSKREAEKLLSESIELAAKTPFGLQDVSNGAKMLLAYGSAAKDVAEEIKMLGNIASGLSIPLNDLIYLYGTTRTQGRMFTQDLRQFMGRGIPLAEELAKQFGVTKDAVGQLVTDGKVGFEQMQTALQAMTSEGGQFFNLMEKQSQTITGQISNLEDSIFQMFNAIGKQNEGIISGSIDVVASLVENYEQVGRTLVGLVATYGVYKTAVMLAAATSKGYTIAELAQYSALVLVEKAQKLLNATMLKNPYVLMATLVASVVAVLISQKNATERLREAEEAYANAKQETIDKEQEHMQKINDLIATAEDEYASTYARRDALHELIRKYPEVFAKYDTELEMLRNIKKIKLEIASIEAGRSITNPTNELDNVNARIAELEALSQQQMPYMGSAGGYQPRMTRGLSRKEQAELEALQKRQRELYGEIANAQRDNYLSGIGSVSDEELAKQIEQTKRAIAQYKERGYISPFGSILGGDVGDNYDPSRLESDLKIFEAEQARRQAPTMTAQDWLASKKQEWTDAEAAYKAFLENKGQLSDEEFERESKRLKEEAESKKKTYMGYAPSGSKGGRAGSKKDDTAEKLKRAADVYSDINAYNEDVRVELLDEGTEKEIEQIKRNYEKKRAEIREQEQKLVTLQGTLTEEQNAALTLALQNAEKVRDSEIAKINKRSQEEASRSMNEYLIAYGSLQEKILATQAKYDAAIAKATTEGEKKMLEAERDALLAEYQAEGGEWAQSLVDMSVYRLSKMAKQLEEQLKTAEDEFSELDSSDSERGKELRKTIDELKAKIKVLEAERGSKTESDGEKNWAKTTEVFQNISSAANEAADSIAEFDEGAANVLRTMANLSGTAINMIGAIKGTMEAFKDGMSAVEKASAILALISVAIQLISTVAGSIIKTNKEYKQTLEDFRLLNEELEKMNKLSKIDSVSGSIFGEDVFGNFHNNLSALRDATKEYNASIDALINRGKEVENGWLEIEDPGTLKTIAHSFDDLGDSISNMMVKTKDYGDFAEFFGARDKYQSLGELAPELFEDGITLEKLKEFQGSDVYDKLSKDNRAYIDDLIANWEYYEDAVEATNAYLTDLFGDLGQTMTDALVDSFASGTDAALAFGEAASDMIERLAKDMIHMAFIQPILEKYSKKIEDMNKEELSPEDRVRQLTELIGQMSQEVLATQDEVNAAAAQVREDASALGYDVFDGTSGQSSSSKGFQAMSQHTGDELNGRFTDIQGKVTGIRDTLQLIHSLNAEQVQKSTSINQTVAMIHNDTVLIEKHTRVLGQMSDDLASIKRAVDNGVI